MDYRYYACPPMAARHEGWLVDGQRIPLVFPAMFPAGFKLIVAFGYKPNTVDAIITTTSNGKITYHYQPATPEESCLSLK